MKQPQKTGFNEKLDRAMHTAQRGVIAEEALTMVAESLQARVTEIQNLAFKELDGGTMTNESAFQRWAQVREIAHLLEGLDKSRKKGAKARENAAPHIPRIGEPHHAA